MELSALRHVLKAAIAQPDKKKKNDTVHAGNSKAWLTRKQNTLFHDKNPSALRSTLYVAACLMAFPTHPSFYNTGSMDLLYTWLIDSVADSLRSGLCLG